MTSTTDRPPVEDWVQVNEDPMAFENVHTGKTVGVRYSEERDSWVWGGPNTAWASDSQAAAREELLAYVRDTRRPSGVM